MEFSFLAIGRTGMRDKNGNGRRSPYHVHGGN